MRGYASARVRIEFHDWKQVLRGAPVKGGNEGWRRKKKKKRKKKGGWTVRGSFSAFPLPLGLLSKAFRRGAKIGKRF